jgi:hypothetical protein
VKGRGGQATLTHPPVASIDVRRVSPLLRACLAVLVLLSSVGVTSPVIAEEEPGCERAGMAGDPVASEPEHGDEGGCSDCSPGCARCLCCAGRSAVPVEQRAAPGPALSGEPLVVGDVDATVAAVEAEIFHPPRA